MLAFVVQSTLNPHEFWSNEWGWGSLDEADWFSLAETKQLNLPMDGQWIELCNAQKENCNEDSL